MTTHGKSRTPEYIVWAAMKSRCLNPQSTGYAWYGGRGIKVCNRWLNNFENFLADMGPKPPDAQIDRIDNNGNYEPSNCRWSDRRTQMNNIRTNRIISFRGKSQTLSLWASELGISQFALKARLDRLGMDLEQALIPGKMRGDGTKRPQITYSFNGKTMTLGGWSETTGIEYSTLWNRIHFLKWTLEKAFTLGLQQ